MTRFRALISLALIALALPLAALELGPQSEIAPSAEVVDPAAPYSVAIGPASLGTPSQVLNLNGPRSRRSWKIPLESTSILTVLEFIQSQLRAQNHSVIYSCAAQECGGFDFRNSRPVLPLPAMYIDLGNFHYFSAEGINSLAEVLISQTAEHLFLQITTIGAGAAQPPESLPTQPSDTASQSVLDLTVSNTAAISRDQNQFQTALETTGKWGLDSLRFTAGTASVAPEGDDALRQVAQFLLDDPKRRIALVGHSDWVGDLATNQRLSLERAAAVAQILIQKQGVPSVQIEIHGIGFLSPRTSNKSDQGRQSNRRVEVVLLPDAAP